MGRRTIRVNALARVEGEGGLLVRLQGRQVTEVQLRIYEPPRLFEALLRGRAFVEAPDITARICGICPVAYQMSSVQAMEHALGVEVPAAITALRRLLYCGEWIESHVLHVFFLHAPDFLGFEDVLQMGRQHPDVVQRALRLKKTGNALMTRIGGRAVHPINVRVGGFHRAPLPAELQALVPDLEWGRDEALRALRWLGELPMPQFERPARLVALHHPQEYPIDRGRVASSEGLEIDAEEYEAHFEEQQIPHSTALHSLMRGHGSYLVGPMARFALNFERLSPLAQDAAREVGLSRECRNPYRSIQVRMVETLWAFDEALRLIAAYEPPEPCHISLEPRAGRGCAVTEAPRGLLYHRYELDEEGTILTAKIVPPTSQNQRLMEKDLRALVEANADLSKDELTQLCEQCIRNFDPCISCATHFLRLQVVKE